MLENLKPERVFHYFEELTKIPRESGNEKAVSDYLYSVGKSLGLETIQDESNNIVIRKPAYKGYENHEPIVIQGHMDMVAEKADGVEHDFLVDPIPVIVDGDWVKTEGTTLGADDGIAVAMGLAILEDKEAKHPALELLVTTDEERTMAGARAVKRELLNGRKLLNIDAEEEGILLSGCSGGHNIIGTLKVKYEKNDMKNTFVLSINNMLGGHSGMEIHQQRGNSLKFALRALDMIKEIADYRLVSIEGGTKHNAIPRDAKAIFTSNADEFNIDFSRLISEYPLDKDMRVSIEKIENVKEVLCKGCQEKIENVVRNIPHGVYSMMEEYPSIVECSDNFAIIKFDGNFVKFTVSLRSSNPKTFEEYTDMVKKVYEENGVRYTLEDYYKPWEFAKVSKLRDIALEVYKKLTGKEMKVEVVHAALEPAVFVDTFPDMEMISIGPTMKDVHSPAERLNILSTQRTFEFVKELLKSL